MVRMSSGGGGRRFQAGKLHARTCLSSRKKGTAMSMKGRSCCARLMFFGDAALLLDAPTDACALFRASASRDWSNRSNDVELVHDVLRSVEAAVAGATEGPPFPPPCCSGGVASAPPLLLLPALLLIAQ